jgi:hypothetical protein
VSRERSHPFLVAEQATSARAELEWDLERENDLCTRSARDEERVRDVGSALRRASGGERTPSSSLPKR